MPRGKPNPKPRTLGEIDDDRRACLNTLAGLDKEYAARKAFLDAQSDAIALERGAVSQPKRLTDVDAADAPRDAIAIGKVPAGTVATPNVISSLLAEPDLTIPERMRRA
jgi:hypothetical protein